MSEYKKEKAISYHWMVIKSFAYLKYIQITFYSSCIRYIFADKKSI